MLRVSQRQQSYFVPPLVQFVFSAGTGTLPSTHDRSGLIQVSAYARLSRLPQLHRCRAVDFTHPVTSKPQSSRQPFAHYLTGDLVTKLTSGGYYSGLSTSINFLEDEVQLGLVSKPGSVNYWMKPPPKLV
jgi:hypothetical protein